MANKQKETQEECSTCFEGMPFAEMMGKMMTGQGVGSLCAEMMQKVIGQQATGSPFDCAEMMKKMSTLCRQAQGEDEKAPKD